MLKETITIEEIKNNSNLNLSKRILKYSSEDLAIASIKQEYEFWYKNRNNTSKEADEILIKILNGDIIDKIEEFELICDDINKIEQYRKMETIKQNISKSKGITYYDFTELCSIIGIDTYTTKQLEQEFINKGLIISSYDKNEPYHK